MRKTTAFILALSIALGNPSTIYYPSSITHNSQLTAHNYTLAPQTRVRQNETQDVPTISPAACGLRNAVGTFMPLFQMRSERDWGIVDFDAMRVAVDFHRATGQNIIQISPINISSANNSPYSVASSRLIDPIYTSVEALLEEPEVRGAVEDFIRKHNERISALRDKDQVDYAEIRKTKREAYGFVWEALRRQPNSRLYREFKEFIREGEDWQLEDHLLYLILKEHYIEEELKVCHWTKIRNWDWRRWEEGLRDRNPQAIQSKKEEYKERILFEAFIQFIADRQFKALREYGEANGVELMIDIPFALDGADIWMHPEVFGLKKESGYKRMVTQGVPPEPAYPAGQYWQFYPYDWSNPETIKFILDLFEFNQRRASYIRLDHVLGYYRTYLFTEDIDGIMTLKNLGLYEEFMALKRLALSEGTENAKRMIAVHAVKLIKDKLLAMREVFQDAVALTLNEDGSLLPDCMIMIARRVPQEQEGQELPETSRWKRESVVEKNVHKGERKWDFIRVTPNKSVKDEGFMYDYLFGDDSRVEENDSIRLGYFKLAPAEFMMSEFLRLAQEKGTTLIWETLGTVPPEIQISVERLGGTNYIPVIWGEVPFWGKQKNPYHPSHHIENAFVTYGLHDSTTMRNRWENELSMGPLTPHDQRRILETVYSSKSRIAVLGWIDILALGEEYRLNQPGVHGNQWVARLPRDVTLEALLAAAQGDDSSSTERAIEAVELIRGLIKEGNRKKPAIEPAQVKLLAVTPEVGGGVIQIRRLNGEPFLIDAYVQGDAKGVNLVVDTKSGKELRIPMEKTKINIRSIRHGVPEGVFKWTAKWKADEAGSHSFYVEIEGAAQRSPAGELVSVEADADLNPLSKNRRATASAMLAPGSRINREKENSPSPFLYEINARLWGKRFKDVGVEDLIRLREQGFNSIWMMGVWQISEASRKIGRRGKMYNWFKGAFGKEFEGSPYAVYDYTINPKLGSEEEFRGFVARAHEVGLKVFVDFVPNHTAVDSPWIEAHPEWYLSNGYWMKHDLLNRGEHNGFFEYEKTGIWIAHGRDINFEGAWKDTAQLDYLNPELRAHMIGVLKRIAALGVDGVRCDMAHFILRSHIKDYWYNRFSQEEFDRLMPKEFWEEAIAEVRKEHPNFAFIAETYQDEGLLQELGFDYTYNKAPYDMLVCGNGPAEFRDWLKFRTSPAYLRRALHFLENHDEQRIASLVSAAKQKAYAVALALLPGAFLVHQGQLEEKQIRVPVQAIEEVEEGNPKTALKEFYAGLARLKALSAFQGRGLYVYDVKDLSGNTDKEVIGYLRKSGNSFGLVVVNCADHDFEGRIDLTGKEEGSAALPSDTLYAITEELSEGASELSPDGLRGLGLKLRPDGFIIYTIEKLQNNPLALLQLTPKLGDDSETRSSLLAPGSSFAEIMAEVEALKKQKKIYWAKVSLGAQRFLVNYLLSKRHGKRVEDLVGTDFGIRLDVLGRDLSGLYNYWWEVKRREEKEAGLSIAQYIAHRLGMLRKMTVEEEIEYWKKKKAIDWETMSVACKRRLVELLAKACKKKPEQLVTSDFKKPIPEFGNRDIDDMRAYYNRLRKKRKIKDKTAVRVLLEEAGIIPKGLSVDEEIAMLREREEQIIWEYVSEACKKRLIEELAKQLRIAPICLAVEDFLLPLEILDEKHSLAAFIAEEYQKRSRARKKGEKPDKRDAVRAILERLGVRLAATVMEELEFIRIARKNAPIEWAGISQEAKRRLVLMLAIYLKKEPEGISVRDFQKPVPFRDGKNLDRLYDHYQLLRNQHKAEDKSVVQFMLEELGIEGFSGLRIVFPEALAGFAGGNEEMRLPADTVSEALTELEMLFPRLKRAELGSPSCRVLVNGGEALAPEFEKRYVTSEDTLTFRISPRAEFLDIGKKGRRGRVASPVSVSKESEEKERKRPTEAPQPKAPKGSRGVTIIIPQLIFKQTGGTREIRIPGETVLEVLDAFKERFPRLERLKFELPLCRVMLNGSTVYPEKFGASVTPNDVIFLSLNEKEFLKAWGIDTRQDDEDTRSSLLAPRSRLRGPARDRWRDYFQIKALMQEADEGTRPEYLPLSEGEERLLVETNNRFFTGRRAPQDFRELFGMLKKKYLTIRIRSLWPYEDFLFKLLTLYLSTDLKLSIRAHQLMSFLWGAFSDGARKRFLGQFSTYYGTDALTKLVEAAGGKWPNEGDVFAVMSEIDKGLQIASALTPAVSRPPATEASAGKRNDSVGPQIGMQLLQIPEAETRVFP